MKKGNKLKVFFTVAIVEMIIVGIFLGYFVYGIVSKSETLRKQTLVLSQKTELAKVANELEMQKVETEKEISSLREKIFNDETLMQFLKDLNSISSAYGLSLDRVSFGELKPVEGFNSKVMILPVSLSLSKGNYDGVVKFLSYLEKQGYSMKPDTISIVSISYRNSNSKENGSQIAVSFSVYVKTNSQKTWGYSSTTP